MTLMRSSKAWIPIVLALGALLFWISAGYFPDQLGYDMYHPWGIANVHAHMPPSSNPYSDTRGYADAMSAYASQTRSAKAWLAEGFWRERTPAHIEPTGTPLYYALLSVLPRDYDASHLTIALAQFACTALAIVLLGRLRGMGALPALAIAFAVELAYNPFIQDVKMANANSAQLAAFALLIYASARGILERRAWIDRLYLPVLAFLVVAKPNILWIAMALAAHYALRRGARATLRGALLSLGAAAAGFALGAWYFGAPGAWADWLRYVGGNGGSLLYSLDGGNQSVAMLMAEKTGGYSAYTYSMILVAAVALAAVVVLTRSGQRADLLVPAARRVLLDPWLAASIAVVLTCATAPLVWPHYFLLNLIPIGWLLLRERRTGLSTGCALLAFAAQSKPLILFLGLFHASGVISSMMAFNWAPLVPALLVHLADARDDVAAARPGAGDEAALRA